jgi:hypothetical protein
VADLLADVISDYGRRFDAQVLDGHGVASPLGAWLLLALCAPLAADPDHTEHDMVTGLLGMEPHAAATALGELLASLPQSVVVAVAAWHRPGAERAGYLEWAVRQPPGVEQGPLPSQAEADGWAGRHTLGMLKRFPADLADPDLGVVLASALATRAEWAHAFKAVRSARLDDPSSGGTTGGWSSQVREVLEARSQHTRLIMRTAGAGLVGVHAAPTKQGLVVVSVIGARDVPRPAVQAAAYDVAALLGGRSTGAEVVTVAELPLGAGPAWTIVEASGPSRVSVVLPAWTASSDHDLLARGQGLGLDIASRLFGELFEDARDPAARQVAYAAFTRTRFEAAALSGMRLGAAMSRPADKPKAAVVRFDHPYAVVAVVDPQPPRWSNTDPPVWRGVPVFSAWVTEPSEPSELER